METSYQPLDLSTCRRRDSNVAHTLTKLPPYSTGSGSEFMETSTNQSKPDRSTGHSGVLTQQYQYAYLPFMKDSFTSQTDPLYYAMQQNQQMFNLAPYMMGAAALQQRLQLMNAWQAGNVSSGMGSSNQQMTNSYPSSGMGSSNQQMTNSYPASGMGSSNQQMTNSYPSQMFAGRDGTLSGPDYPTNHSGVVSQSLVNSGSPDKLETLRMEMRGGHPTFSPEKMRPPSTTDSTDSSDIGTATNNNNTSHSWKRMVKDNQYLERRRKNNISAKMSRDRRRNKEDEIAIRAVLLENKNRNLHAELSLTRKQVLQNDAEISALRMELIRRGESWS